MNEEGTEPMRTNFMVLLTLVLVTVFIPICRDESRLLYGQLERFNEMKDSTVEKNGWEFAKVEGRNIVFKDGSKYHTNVFDLQYIGQLRTSRKAPYLILAGRKCQACDESISIYIQSPSDGPMKADGEDIRYSYPGKEFDYETKKIDSETRMFYGSCSDSGECSVIWYQRELDDKGKWEESIYSIRVRDDQLIEEKTSDAKRIIQILDRVIRNCKELPGVDVTSEP